MNELFQTFHKASSSSQEELSSALKEITSLAWKCVTMASPIVICQPQGHYDKQTMDTEMYHWNKIPQDYSYRLVYSHPVIYRSYRGIHKHKGTVGNELCLSHEDQCTNTTICPRNTDEDGRHSGCFISWNNCEVTIMNIPAMMCGSQN